MANLEMDKQEEFINSFNDPEFTECLKEGATVEDKTIITETKQTEIFSNDESANPDISYEKTTDSKIFSTPPKSELEINEKYQYTNVDPETGFKSHTSLVKAERRVQRVSYLNRQKALSVFERVNWLKYDLIYK
jgi:hypothetical protein